MIKLKPTKGRVIIEPLIEKISKVGSIVIPDKHQDPSTEGIVVALPSDNKLELQIGDRVIFARFGGIDIASGKRKFKMLEPTEILAKVE